MWLLRNVMNILNRLIPAMSFKWFVFDVQVLNRAYAKLVPDLIVPMSEHRTFKYFKEETLQKYAEQYGWTLIDDSNRKDMFMDMIRQMDMSYSYKPVLMKAMMQYADDKVRIKLDDIVAFFKAYYEARREAGLIVEKKNSIFAKVVTPTKKLNEIFSRIPSSDLRICR